MQTRFDRIAIRQLHHFSFHFERPEIWKSGHQRRQRGPVPGNQDEPIFTKSDNIRKRSPPKYYFFRFVPAEIDTYAKQAIHPFIKKEDQ